MKSLLSGLLCLLASAAPIIAYSVPLQARQSQPRAMTTTAPSSSQPTTSLSQPTTSLSQHTTSLSQPTTSLPISSVPTSALPTATPSGGAFPVPTGLSDCQEMQSYITVVNLAANSTFQSLWSQDAKAASSAVEALSNSFNSASFKLSVIDGLLGTSFTSIWRGLGESYLTIASETQVLAKEIAILATQFNGILGNISTTASPEEFGPVLQQFQDSFSPVISTADQVTANIATLATGLANFSSNFTSILGPLISPDTTNITLLRGQVTTVKAQISTLEASFESLGSSAEIVAGTQFGLKFFPQFSPTLLVTAPINVGIMSPSFRSFSAQYADDTTTLFNILNEINTLECAISDENAVNNIAADLRANDLIRVGEYVGFFEEIPRALLTDAAAVMNWTEQPSTQPPTPLQSFMNTSMTQYTFLAQALILFAQS